MGQCSDIACPISVAQTKMDAKNCLGLRKDKKKNFIIIVLNSVKWLSI